MAKHSASAKSVVITALLVGILAISSAAQSKARIVRLSELQGAVQIDRNLGQGYERAFLNMPVTEGMRLWAKDDGRAEVEFEDGSVVRLVPNSRLDFSRLSLSASGEKQNTLRLGEGTAYVNFKGQRNDEFILEFARERIALDRSAHFRVDMNDAQANLAVFQGDVNVEGPAGRVELGKKQSANFDLADNDRYTVAKNFEEDQYDAWDKQQDQYHQRGMSNSYTSSYPYSYGASDLNYYGNFMNVPGYGNMWQPYLTGAGWNPYQDGGWSYYPGAGYTWVSAYPWGWMPYRYGSWVFVPQYGWLWQPGGWNGWVTGPRVVNPPRRFVSPQPPVRGHATVAVGAGPAYPPVVPPHRIVVSSGQAGLGVPRGAVKELGKVAGKVTTSGPVEIKVPHASSGFGDVGNRSTGPVVSHPSGWRGGESQSHPTPAPTPHASTPSHGPPHR